MGDAAGRADRSLQAAVDIHRQGPVVGVIDACGRIQRTGLNLRLALHRDIPAADVQDELDIAVHSHQGETAGLRIAQEGTFPAEDFVKRKQDGYGEAVVHGGFHRTGLPAVIGAQAGIAVGAFDKGRAGIAAVCVGGGPFPG